MVSEPGRYRNIHTRRDSELFIISAGSPGELLPRCRSLGQFLRKNPHIPLPDLAYTLNCPGPQESSARVAIVATSAEELNRKLEYAVEKLADPACKRIKEISGIYFFRERLADQGQIAFLFPGEGAQYPNMFKDICLHFPAVRMWFDLMDRAFRNHKRGFLPSQVIFPPPATRPDGEDRTLQQLWNMDSAIEAVFTANQAMYTLLSQLRIHAQAIVGHSTGEYSALIAAGAAEVKDEDQFVKFILEGNKITERAVQSGLVPRGVLLAVGPADPEILRNLLVPENGSLFLAMDNCPHQVVLCGSEETIERVQTKLRARGAVCMRLPFNRAYHTPLFRAVCEELREFYEQVKFVTPEIPLYSCATAAPFPNDPGEIRRLALEQWALPVRFRETIEAMYQAGIRIFIEVGPRGNLSAFVEDILRQKDHVAIPSNVTTRSGITQLHHLLGMLAAQGVNFAPEPLYEGRGARKLPLDAIGAGAELPANPDHSIPLSLALPRLHIDKSRLPISGTAAAAEQSPPGPTRDTSQKPAESPVNRVSPSFSASNRESLQQPSAKAEVMDKYLRTMAAFLEGQKKVMHTFLNRRYNGAAGREAQRPFSGEGNAPASSIDADSVSTVIPEKETPGPIKSESSLPFAGTIKKMAADAEVIVSRTLDLKKDTYLYDHCLGPKLSEYDPQLIPLPVFPLALSIEMMTEVASLLFPGMIVTELREVQAYRWIALKSEQCRLDIHAHRRDGSDEVLVKITEVTAGEAANGAGPLLIQGIVCFGKQLPAPYTATGVSPLHPARASIWEPAQLYREGERHGMFHGPAFQGVASLNRVAENGADAMLQNLSLAEKLASPGNFAFLTAPSLLDSAGQVVGFWAADWLKSASVIFPVGFRSLKFYRPADRLPAKAICHARITELKKELIKTNLKVVDSDDTIVFEVQGWEDKRFDLPGRFYTFRLNPEAEMVSLSWEEALAQYPQAEQFRCCRLEFPPGFLQADFGIWQETFVHLTFGRDERKAWQELRGPDSRRIEWLLGRVVAKDAVRLLLRERYGLLIYPADIEIAADEYGQPRAAGPWIERIGNPPAISIAHSGGLAVAIARDVNDRGERPGVGIDIERPRHLEAGFEEIAFIESERKQLMRIDPANYDEWILRLWCSKEAAAKALGRGLIDGAASVIVREIDIPTGEISLSITGELAREYPEKAGRPIKSRTAGYENLIFAIAEV